MRWLPLLLWLVLPAWHLQIHQFDPSLPFIDFFVPTITMFIHSNYFCVQLFYLITRKTRESKNYKYSNTRSTLTKVLWYNDRTLLSTAELSQLWEIHSCKYPVAEHILYTKKDASIRIMVMIQPHPWGPHLVGLSLDLYHCGY